MKKRWKHDVRNLHRQRGSALLACVVCALPLAGCPLDNRRLDLAESDDAGGSTEPVVQGGGASSAHAGQGQGAGDSRGASGTQTSRGASGQGDPSQPLIDGCVDLDMNGVPDCRETLLVNSGFATDTSAWTVEAPATLSWDTDNPSSDRPSGSALLAITGAIDPGVSGAMLRVASQCVQVASSELVIAYANAFVDSGQDSLGYAEVDVFFFDSVDCKGPARVNFSTPQPVDAMAGSWLTLHADAVTGVATRSALVKLAIAVPYRARSFHARFDNILLTVREP